MRRLAPASTHYDPEPLMHAGTAGTTDKILSVRGCHGMRPSPACMLSICMFTLYMHVKDMET